MASQRTAEERARRDIGPAAVVSCVLAALFLATNLSASKVSWLRNLRDTAPNLFSGALLVMVLLAFAVAILFGSQRSVRRRALAHPIPAGLWARANGCTYTFFDRNLEPALLDAAGIRSSLFQGAYDVVQGQ